jgi:hypothetical protein
MSSGSLTTRSSQIKYTDGGAQTYQLRVPLQALSTGMEWPANSRP